IRRRARIAPASDPPCDPDRVLAALVGPAVEPAVEGFELEARLVQENTPLGRREPGQGHRRRGVATANREGQRSLALVPIGPLEDARLALEPAAVRGLDIVLARREDVEDEPAGGLENT